MVVMSEGVYWECPDRGHQKRDCLNKEHLNVKTISSLGIKTNSLTEGL